MSQHQFKATTTAGIAVVVECGYDRILNQFHLSIDTPDALREDADEASEQQASPVHYTSLMERGGGVGLHQLGLICEKRGVELPAGLYFELNAEKEANMRTNYFVSWPLYPEQQANLDHRMMVHGIASELHNNDTDDEAAIILDLHHNYPTLDVAVLAKIVLTELPKLRGAFWETIHWAEYDLAPGYALVGLVPVAVSTDG